MGETEKRITDLMNNVEKLHYDTTTLETFEKSSKEFQNLIEQGLTKSRGYNLQTIEDRMTFAFNATSSL